jgi:hypothetical protein
MMVILDVFGGLVQSKSNGPMTATARRKYFAGDRGYLMRQGVVIAI